METLGSAEPCSMVACEFALPAAQSKLINGDSHLPCHCKAMATETSDRLQLSKHLEYDFGTCDMML